MDLADLGAHSTMQSSSPRGTNCIRTHSKNRTVLDLKPTQSRRTRRYFVMEHPDAARSWSTKLLGSLLHFPRVQRVAFDFCMLGMTSRDGAGSAPAKKRTALATNSEAIAASASRYQCDHRHRHVHLIGGKSRPCQEYTEEFREIAPRSKKNLGGTVADGNITLINQRSVCDDLPVCNQNHHR